MNKYHNGKIYKLVCDNSPLIYYGSTYETLEERLEYHKDMKNNRCSSLKLFELGKVSIHLVKNFPCDSKKELLKEERLFIEIFLKCFPFKIICNKRLPFITKEEKKIYNKKYYQTNKKELYEKEKEKRPQKRELINQQARERYKENKEKYIEHFKCPCGGQYTKQHKSRHFKTKKHLKYLENNDK